MPIFFFHLVEGEETFNDPEGVELPDLAEIERHARKGASELIAEAVRRGDRNYRGRLDAVDEKGNAILTLTFTFSVGMEVRSEIGSGSNVHRLHG